MKVFFGAAIQGAKDRGKRAPVYRTILETIKSLGHSVFSEHTGALSKEENTFLLNQAIGPLPEIELDRRICVRNKMIEAIESPDLGAIVFEVSTPSLGTGIEFAHAYLRPRLGIHPVPILALYEIDHWPHHLSTMIRGISGDIVPHLKLVDYQDEKDLKKQTIGFFKTLN
jgi:hypothetical protein